MYALSTTSLSKTYKTASGKDLTVLNGVNFDVEKGERLAIVGPSGSGKTTLLGLCASLDTASSGEVELLGHKLSPLNEDQRARLRNQHIGFVFQNFQLLPTLTALENVMVPIELQGKKGAKNSATELLAQVGLADRGHHYPTQLSGGEQQRVAVARAFANQPDILFADEPTGNLDEETGQKVEELIFALNQQQQTTLVLVTHDMELAARTGRVLKMKGGQLISDSANS